MKRTKTKPAELSKFLDAIGDCMTPEAAKKILTFKADKKLQARVLYLGEQSNSGLLTREEHAEYGELIRQSTMISILQSKARRLLADHQ
jgi:hypothetical protein